MKVSEDLPMAPGEITKLAYLHETMGMHALDKEERDEHNLITVALRRMVDRDTELVETRQQLESMSKLVAEIIATFPLGEVLKAAESREALVSYLRGVFEENARLRKEKVDDFAAGADAAVAISGTFYLYDGSGNRAEERFKERVQALKERPR